MSGADKQKEANRSRDFYRALRKEVITAYGHKCQCPSGHCNETRLEFLAMDHVFGGGNTHRRKLRGVSLYRWLKANGFPKDFRVLCHNCNMSFGVYRYCPHDESAVRLPTAVGT